MVKNYPG